jgi:hypothetical protein
MRSTVCDQLGPIGPRLLERFACDALLQHALLTPTGALLNLGRDTRTITTTQRRALNARDRGCVIPGCTASPSYCEGHHITWWRNNGPTDIDNLALLCPRHHTLIHLRVWDLAMVNGIPYARPPTWIDPHRNPIRNTLHHDADTATHLGHQLHLTLDPPTPPPWLHSPRPDATHTNDDIAHDDGTGIGSDGISYGDGDDTGIAHDGDDTGIAHGHDAHGHDDDDTGIAHGDDGDRIGDVGTSIGLTDTDNRTGQANTADRTDSDNGEQADPGAAAA